MTDGVQSASPGASPVDPDVEFLALRERAIVATELAFSMADPRREDTPLVWVNPAFTTVTGYEMDEVIGRNCRFLQGPATDSYAVDELRRVIDQRRSATVTLLNYRKDGTAFWNQLSLSPVFSDEGELISYVGVQSDVTLRVTAEQGRLAAQAEAERAREHLAMLAEATSQLASTLDVTESLDRLANLVVPLLADWVVVNLVDDDGRMLDVAMLHRDGCEDLLESFAKMQPSALTTDSIVRRVLSSGLPVLMPEMERANLSLQVNDLRLVDLGAELGMSSAMCVPLAARNRVFGAMTLIVGRSGRRFNDDDLRLAADLGRRAALTLDNARLYEREHQVAETLQRSLLPELPQVEGLSFCARYLASSNVADVGGDFYEILPLPDGAIGVAVGDVVGHDLAAAAAMGHLRGLLRACAWDTAADDRGAPAQVLSRVDRLVQGLHVAPLATVFYARLERPETPDLPWLLRYSSAGHPSALLRTPDGAVEVLDQANGLLLGVMEDYGRFDAVVAVPIGSTLIAYTDGLVERRGEHLDEGLDRLVRALSQAEDPSDLNGLTGLLAAAAGIELYDDVALVAVHLG